MQRFWKDSGRALRDCSLEGTTLIIVKYTNHPQERAAEQNLSARVQEGLVVLDLLLWRIQFQHPAFFLVDDS